MLKNSPQHRPTDGVSGTARYLELPRKQLYRLVTLGAGCGWCSGIKHESDGGVCHSKRIRPCSHVAYERVCSSTGGVLSPCLSRCFIFCRLSSEDSSGFVSWNDIFTSLLIVDFVTSISLYDHLRHEPTRSETLWRNSVGLCVSSMCHKSSVRRPLSPRAFTSRNRHRDYNYTP